MVTPAIIFGVFPSTFPEYAPEKSGLRAGGLILAIDGEPIVGMSRERFQAVWWNRDVGEKVRLIVQGIDDEDARYREVVMKCVANTQKRHGLFW